MVIQGQIGPTSNADGTTFPMRMGRQGDQMVSHLHARYYEATMRGKRFFVANTARVTTTVGLATTYTGLCLSNPPTSVVNMVIDTASMNQDVIQATQVEAYGLATGFSTTAVTHTTPVTPRPCLVGSANTPVGLADAAATLPTAPFYTRFVTNTGTATANSTGNLSVDVAGAIILPPGGYILWVTPTQASVGGMWFSFEWEEVPVNI